MMFHPASFVRWLFLRLSNKKLSFIPHLQYLKNKCLEALNLLRVVANTKWGSDEKTLLHLYRSLI